MLREIKNSILFLIIFSILLGIVYPFFIRSIGDMFFPRRADGSLIIQQSTIVGSQLIGQEFTEPQYFHGRPSASHYDPMNSGGTNVSIKDKLYVQLIQQRIHALQKENNKQEKVPVDLLESSGSGLDPEISVVAADYQVKRVAQARQVSPLLIEKILQQHIIKPELGIFGEPRVNVLLLNLALDAEINHHG